MLIAFQPLIDFAIYGMVNALLDYNYMMHGSQQFIVTMKYQIQHYVTADLTRIRGIMNGIKENMSSPLLKVYTSEAFLLFPAIILGKSRVTVLLLIPLICRRWAV